jgi:hypothetical protein
MTNSVFKMSSEIKEEFSNLKEYTESTNYRNRELLLVVDSYEESLNIDVFKFTYENITDLFLTVISSSSLGSVESKLSVLKSYVSHCIARGLVPTMENKFANLDKKFKKSLVSQHAIENSYFNWETIKYIEKKVENDMDKLIMELVYLGVKGRSKKNCTCEELRNMRIEHISENNTINLYKNNGRFRTINLPLDVIELIKRVNEEKIYYVNNGEERSRLHSSNIETKKLENTGYIFRPINSKSPFGQVHELFFVQQLSKIGVWTDTNYLNVKNLYYSGMIEQVVNIHKETGELPTPQQLFDIISEADFGNTKMLKYQYSQKIKHMSIPYLMNKQG